MAPRKRDATPEDSPSFSLMLRFRVGSMFAIYSQ